MRPRPRHRHSRAHHRETFPRWQARRRRILHIAVPWMDDPKPQDYDRLVTPHRLNKKRKDDRHREEKRFRQSVRNALGHGDPLPRYRPDYAD